jgi:hypothetical protein
VLPVREKSSTNAIPIKLIPLTSVRSRVSLFVKLVMSSTYPLQGRGPGA